MTLVEASPRLGGQFRLAGLQPSRGQILDLLDWYERSLAGLGVEVRLGEEMSAVAVAAAGADEVIVATGSRPPGTGFQRALPMVDRLPGVDAANVVSIHDVLDGTAAAGQRVLVLDDLDDWRGLGTALHLAERDHEVTLITAAPVVARGLFHSAVDGPLRKRYALAGGRWITSAAILGWRDGVALVRSTLTGELTKVDADTLVIAETPVAVVGLAEDLRARGHGLPRHRRLRGAAPGEPRLPRGSRAGASPLRSGRRTMAGTRPTARPDASRGDQMATQDLEHPAVRRGRAARQTERLARPWTRCRT